jgi:hypothetical protein
VPLIVIERQLGHSNLGITSVCLQGIDHAVVDAERLLLAGGGPLVPNESRNRVHLAGSDR